MHEQSINQSVANAGSLDTGLQGLYTNTRLNVAVVGTTAEGTLRFQSAGAFDPNIYDEQGTLAVDGTSVAIIQPGIYRIEAVVMQQGQDEPSLDNTYAIAMGATAVTGAAPTFATQGVVRLFPNIVSPFVMVTPVVMTATVLVSLPRAKAALSATSSNTIRILATIAAGGPPLGILTNDCSLRINRINNLYS